MEETSKTATEEETSKETKPEEGKELEAIKAEAKRLLEGKKYSAEEIVEAVEEALGLHDEENEEDNKAEEKLGQHLWGMGD